MVNISKFSRDNVRYQNLLARQGGIPKEVENTVHEILANVRAKGDVALHEYMERFDGVKISEIGLMVTSEEMANAREMVSTDFKEAVKRACDNIRNYHKNQLPDGYTEGYADGVELTRRYRPLQRVAVTVPGNMAPLCSTLCMALIPALVVGVPEIYILTKPRKDGTIDEHLLYIADYLGVHNYYKISGAQGLAAVAYGTETIPKVDAIVGPGNNYTQMAKKLLYGEVRIDSLAGPSEIAIIADEDANARFVAADMMSQAEHGTGFEASTTFCLSYQKAEEIQAAIGELTTMNQLESSTGKSFANYGDIFVVDSLEEAVTAVNEIAPEHAEIMVKEPEKVLDTLTNAGAVFVGEYSCEPVGDYFCGTNHILPTCGTARFSSGLSVLDFMRGYSIINYTKKALLQNGDYIETLANTEGLRAHVLAVSVRKEG